MRRLLIQIELMSKKLDRIRELAHAEGDPKMAILPAIREVLKS
jgi:hypothetical protein